MTTLDRFNAHRLICKRCREQLTNLCPAGKKLWHAHGREQGELMRRNLLGMTAERKNTRKKGTR